MIIRDSWSNSKVELLNTLNDLLRVAKMAFPSDYLSSTLASRAGISVEIVESVS